jgi:hypothetical protein
MNSLSELRDHLLKQEIVIKEFTGWKLKVGKDTWTLSDGVFYKNNQPQSVKQKDIFDSYKKGKANDSTSIQTRKWRGISSRNYRGNGNSDHV